MRDVMTRRGPDDAGLECGPGFAPGHRRLSIIDLSPAGHQPMENEDGRVVITFNGEIYNFADLRPDLEKAGHRFRSRSDTEMLLHGYEQWGLEGLLRRIRGMYAFAIVILRRAATIHLVRDPLGKKPLFFRWSGGELLFASSARALAEALDAPPEVDPVSVDALLWNRYIPGPRTIFAGVEKLPPGHAWSLASDGSTTLYRHWRPDFFHPEEGIGEDVSARGVEDALTTAVRRLRGRFGRWGYALRRRRLQPGDGPCGQDDGERGNFLRGQRRCGPRREPLCAGRRPAATTRTTTCCRCEATRGRTCRSWSPPWANRWPTPRRPTCWPSPNWRGGR